MAKTKQKKKIQVPASIKQRLMAATAMLLVSSILLVTSTYAWFTLSTAPEVTGITTSVGANGNLEIALLTAETNADTSLITSAVGDSYTTKARTESNATWGNIVDLSDDSYGLGQISLMPSRLNAVAGSSDGNTKPTVTTASPLMTPVYGSDGRVSSLEANTTTGTYSDTGLFEYSTSAAGVRAIGTTSSLNERQLNYRNYAASATTYASKAKSLAASALSTNGSALGNIVMKKAMDENATYTQDDVDALQALVTALGSANDAVGQALKSASIAYAASGQNEGKTDGTDKYATVIAYTSDTSVDDYITNSGLGSTTAGAAAKVSYDDTVTKLTSAKSALTTLGTKESYTWSDINSVLTNLVDTSKIKVNGSTSSEIKNNLGTFIGSAMSNGVSMVMGTGSGVFTNISDICGNYSANVQLTVTYSGNDIPLTAGMSTDSQGGTPSGTTPTGVAYATAIAGDITTAGQPASTLTEGDSSTSATNLSDIYGYALDFAVRTNASGSNLMLQTTAAQRVYSDSTNTETLGGGSTMDFTSDSLSSAQLANLMGAVRVAFVDGDNQLVGIAVLDQASIGSDSTTVTYEKTDKTIVSNGESPTSTTYIFKGSDGKYYGTTSTSVTNENASSSNLTELTEAQLKAAGLTNGGTAKGNLKLVNFTVSESGVISITKATEYTKVGTEQVNIGTSTAEVKKYIYSGSDGKYYKSDAASADASGASFTAMSNTEIANAQTNGATLSALTASNIDFKGDNEQTLMALTQNETTKISVIVYLDGDVVDNSDVAATSAESMTGSLNLQFSSDAELDPMDNTALFGTTTLNGDSTAATLTYTATSPASFAYNEATYYVYKGSDDNYYYRTSSTEGSYTKLEGDLLTRAKSNNCVPNS